MKKKIIMYSALSLAFLIIFIIMCILIKNSGGDPLSIDAKIRDFFYEIRGNKNGFNYYLSNIVTYLGDTIAVFLVGFIILIFTKGDNKVFSFFLGVVIALCLNVVIKEIFQRDRPFAEYFWAHENDASFPSGHSVAAAYIYSFSIYLIIKSKFNKILKTILSIACGLLIVVVVVSRLTLGVHYFSDVIAGLSLGFTMVFLSILFEEFLIQFGIFEKPILVSIHDAIKSRKNKKEEKQIENKEE